MTLEQRFWSDVDKRGANECWPWAGARNKKGYGLFRLRPSENRRLAHRVAWALERGEISDGQCVLHKCDNPPCCNPAHHFLGTRADNIVDMMSKRRDLHPRGAQHGRAKLTEDDVLDIRAVLAFGGTRSAIARAYGVGISAISAIASGKTWAHIP